MGRKAGPDLAPLAPGCGTQLLCFRLMGRDGVRLSGWEWRPHLARFQSGDPGSQQALERGL